MLRLEVAEHPRQAGGVGLARRREDPSYLALAGGRQVLARKALELLGRLLVGRVAGKWRRRWTDAFFAFLGILSLVRIEMALLVFPAAAAPAGRVAGRPRLAAYRLGNEVRLEFRVLLILVFFQRLLVFVAFIQALFSDEVVD